MSRRNQHRTSGRCRPFLPHLSPSLQDEIPCTQLTHTELTAQSIGSSCSRLGFPDKQVRASSTLGDDAKYFFPKVALPIHTALQEHMRLAISPLHQNVALWALKILPHLFILASPSFVVTLNIFSYTYWPMLFPLLGFPCFFFFHFSTGPLVFFLWMSGTTF